MNRSQSPISTASPSPVKVATPRMAPSRDTIGAHSGVAAVASICSSNRSRWAVVASTASSASSNAVRVPGRSNRWALRRQ
ncbi:MAG: hypothetical protein ACXV0U_02475 [Kineosporiaceae bacterium]